MEFRVSINGTILKNNPTGLNSFKKEFTLDSDIFGVYSTSSFDLVFIGDGYCILRDLFDNESTCEIFVKIEQYYNKSWVVVFDAVAEVGSLKIDYSVSQATLELQDNSPLVLISRNSSLKVDLESTKDIFDNPLSPASFSSYTIGTPKNSSAYNSNGVYWDELVRFVLEAITGRSVNVLGNYLQKVAQPCIYTLTCTGDLSQVLETTVEFKNFQGVTQTITANFQTGLPHLAEISQRLLSSTQFLNDNNGISKALELNDDYRNFYKTDVNAPTKTITCYSNLPIEIISINSTSSFSPITWTITKTQEFEDGGNNPVFFNYRSLRNETSPYLFYISFREIMEALNKEYNVYFTAKFNSSGDIDIIIEDAGYFFNITPNLFFENPQNIELSFSDEMAYSQVTLGDASSTTLASSSRTLSTNFCAIENNYDAKSNINVGSVKIWEDLAGSYQNGNEGTFYIIDNNGSMYDAQWTNDNYTLLIKTTGFVYNLYLTNWHKIYRHFYKFKGNIIGLAPYFDFDTINYNIDIINIAPRRFYREIKFKTSLLNNKFNTLTDNIVDMCAIKIDTNKYQEGLITSVTYNYNTGEADFIILGENKYVSNY